MGCSWVLSCRLGRQQLYYVSPISSYSFFGEGIVTPVDIFNGTTQSVLAVRYFSEPQKLAQGKWSIDMVANLVVFQGSNQVGKAIAFNKTIFVRAIDTPLPPPNSAEVQRIAYGVRKAGLEIYKIQDLEIGK